MVDTGDLKSPGEIRTGSIPVARTIPLEIVMYWLATFYTLDEELNLGVLDIAVIHGDTHEERLKFARAYSKRYSGAVNYITLTEAYLP